MNRVPPASSAFSELKMSAISMFFPFLKSTPDPTSLGLAGLAPEDFPAFAKQDDLPRAVLELSNFRVIQMWDRAALQLRVAVLLLWSVRALLSAVYGLACWALLGGGDPALAKTSLLWAVVLAPGLHLVHGVTRQNVRKDKVAVALLTPMSYAERQVFRKSMDTAPRVTKWFDALEALRRAPIPLDALAAQQLMAGPSPHQPTTPVHYS